MKYYIAHCFTTEPFDSYDFTSALKASKAYIHDFNGPYVAFPGKPVRETNHGRNPLSPVRVSIICSDDPDSDEFRRRLHLASKEWPFDLADWEECQIDEVTFEECAATRSATRWVPDEVPDQIVNALDLHELVRLLRRSTIFNEYLLDSVEDDDELRSLAARTDYSRSLLAEVDRIAVSAAHGTDAPRILPVHYIVRGTNPRSFKRATDVLFQALEWSGRTRTGHVFNLNLDAPTSFFESRSIGTSAHDLITESFAEAIRSNLLVVQYGAFDTTEGYDETRHRVFTRLLERLQPILDTTQVVFVIPSDRRDVEARLIRALGRPVMVLDSDATPSALENREEALEYLLNRAQRQGFTDTSGLEETLDEMTAVHSFEDLDEVYAAWRAQCLLERVYPEYQDDSVVAPILREAEQRSALETLDSLIGLTEVKARIHEILTRAQMNRELAAKGLPVREFTMHSAFLGAPGTGKTEVARLFALVLKEEGILSEGRLVQANASTLLNMGRLFREARGSVLFIDEAYVLCQAQVTELIALMENRRHDVVVILAGYRPEMEGLISSNAGFRSRIGSMIDFPDYSPAELVEIFQLMAKRAEIIVPKKVLEIVRERLSRTGRPEDQGNARFVRTIFEDAIGAQQVRLAKKRPKNGYSTRALRTLAVSDVEDRRSAPSSEASPEASIPARKRLARLVGLDQVKTIVSNRLDLLAVQKVRRDRGIDTPWIPMHMAFTGNPGTGKTEVARLVGRILREEGVLSVGDVLVCGRQDLVGQYVGHTAPKVQALFRKARGSVLFIDEAYSLVSGGERRDAFAEEAVTTLIDLMEKYRDEVVVILAGYTEQMTALLDSNPGFRSRVKFHIEFPDYSDDDLVAILHSMAQREKVVLGEGVDERVRGFFETARALPGFGNARFARSLLEDAVVQQSVRLSAAKNIESVSDKELALLTADDFVYTPPAGAKPKRRVGFAV